MSVTWTAISSPFSILQAEGFQLKADAVFRLQRQPKKRLQMAARWG